MKYTILPEAESELIDAVTFLNSRERNLGLEFAAEVHETIERILENPAAWPVLRGPVKRAITRRFPYSIFFVVEPDGIQVVAISHSSRQPDFWHDRL